MLVSISLWVVALTIGVRTQDALRAAASQTSLDPGGGKIFTGESACAGIYRAPDFRGCGASPARHDARLLEYLSNSFKDEFNYWNDHLKSVSLMVVAIGVLFGIGATEEMAGIAAVISSWTLFVGLHMSKVTQRGLRYFKRQLFLARGRG